MGDSHTLTSSLNVGSHSWMPALLRKFNYRNIVLADGVEAENVGVLDASGYPRYFPWCGFISSDQLVASSITVSLRLEIHAYSHGDGYMDSWRAIPEGKYVLGCQIGYGVYGVLEKGRPILT